MESWNDGLKETRIQTAYDVIDFLVLVAYFSEKHQKKMPGEQHLKKADSTFFL